MSKNLIVYYSLTGNTKYIAEAMKESMHTDMLELKPVKELKAEGSSKYFWGGYQATMKRRPKLNPITLNLSEYDLIIIGSPVWAWTICPPIRSFLSKFNLAGKNIALWMCCAGDGIKSMERFKIALKNSNIVGDISFQEPLQNHQEEDKRKAIAWVKSIAEQYN